MKVPLGFIYCLKNPVTGEIFYVGATQVSLTNRLRTHYQHLREFERGLRKTNKRYVYLQNLRPLKAEICLLELIQDGDMDEREIFYIKKIRSINPNITNMTDGGKGSHTSKYYTEKEMEEYFGKLSKKNIGREKPFGFAENLSKARKGLGNPAAKEMKDWLVAFSDNIPISLFKYGFEINDFVGSRHAHSNVKRLYKTCKPYKLKWIEFKNCKKEVQDIVQSIYESK